MVLVRPLALDPAPDSAGDHDQWGVLDYDRLHKADWHLAPLAGQPVMCDAQGRLLQRHPTAHEMATRLVEWLQSHAWLHGTRVTARWLEIEVYPKFSRALWGGPPPVPYTKVAQAIRVGRLMLDFRGSVNVGGKEKKLTMYVVPDPNVAANVVELAERKRA